MTTCTRSTRLPMPLRIDDEPWATPAGVRIAPTPPSASLEVWPDEPPFGFVDSLVTAARQLDPDARALILPSDHETPMARRLRERLEAAATHPATRAPRRPAHVQP